MLLFAIVFTLFFVAAVGFAVRWRARRPAEASSAVLFLLPSLVHLCVFLLAPLVFSLWMSFHRWSILSDARDFVGLGNFRYLFSTPHFYIALRNTALFALNVPVTMALSLLVAVALRNWVRGRRFLLPVFFLPNICLFTAVAVVWKWLYNPEHGFVNRLVGSIPGVSESIPWLESIDLVGGVLPLPILAILVMWVWLHIGVQAVIFSAGLEGIPETYYEAARIDGATPVQTFFSVTLPLLRPATGFVLVTSIIASFQVFTAVYVMVDRTVLRTRAVDVLVYQIYDYAWGGEMRMGLASALSWILFLIILAVSLAQYRFIRKGVEYE
jgi:multiple sugar transport system permease protein